MPEDNRFQPLSTVSLSGDDTSPQESQIGPPTNESPWSEDFQVTKWTVLTAICERGHGGFPSTRQKQGAFDNRSHGVIGDPGAQFGGVRQLDI